MALLCLVTEVVKSLNYALVSIRGEDSGMCYFNLLFSFIFWDTSKYLERHDLFIFYQYKYL